MNSTSRLFATTTTIAVLMTAAATCVVVGCGRLEKVPEAEVDGAQKATAQGLATRIYDGCRSGQHQALREDEAIKEMRDALTPAKLASTCAVSKSQFGDYVSMDYAETYKQGSLRVYRFKGHFSNTTDTPEIRVVMDSSNKLSGFWLKPWQNHLR